MSSKHKYYHQHSFTYYKVTNKIVLANDKIMDLIYIRMNLIAEFMMYTVYTMYFLVSRNIEITFKYLY